MTPETRNLLQSWQTRFFVKTYYCWDSVDWCYHVLFVNQTFFKINAGEIIEKISFWLFHSVCTEDTKQEQKASKLKIVPIKKN